MLEPLSDEDFMEALGYPVCMTHQEIADELGISKQRVGRILENAMKKVRNNFESFLETKGD